MVALLIAVLGVNALHCSDSSGCVSQVIEFHRVSARVVVVVVYIVFLVEINYEITRLLTLSPP